MYILYIAKIFSFKKSIFCFLVLNMNLVLPSVKYA